MNTSRDAGDVAVHEGHLYSYSKSLTARRPRYQQAGAALAREVDEQPAERAHLDARLVLERRADERDALVDREERLLRRVVATATMSRSTYSRLRCMRSSCPRVIGSKLPA
jgi:hypothetical protein